MNPIRRIRRLGAALAGALLTFAVAAPAALARSVPPPTWPAPPAPGSIPQPVLQAPVPVRVHTVIVGGMPGWQIALIAVGAALLAATAAVLLERAWAARRKTITAGA